MSPDPFDEIDAALRSGLSRLAPELGDEDATLAAMRPRLRRARTRARLAKAGGAIFGLVAIGSVAAIATVHTGPDHVSVTSRSSTSVSTAPRSSTSTTVSAPAVSVPTTTPVSAPGVVTNPTTPGATVPHPGATTPGTVPSTTPGATDDHGGGPGGGGGGGNSGPGAGPTSTTTTVPASADQVVVYQSTGGSITVRFSQHTTLTLVRVAPASGYAPDVRESGPDRIDVRFRQGEEVKSEIGVRVENGQMVRTDHG